MRCSEAQNFTPIQNLGFAGSDFPDGAKTSGLQNPQELKQERCNNNTV
jgi:hypothetical protein